MPKYNPLYSFDDIEEGDEIIHRGKRGWVVDKGRGVSNVSGEHVKIQYFKGEAPKKRNTINLKKTVVNRMIDKGETWVNFDNHLHNDATDFAHGQ
jgi:hypothetical protein